LALLCARLLAAGACAAVNRETPDALGRPIPAHAASLARGLHFRRKRPQAEYLAGFGGRRHAAPARARQLCHPRNELRVARREALPIEPDVVLEPGAAMSAELERPFVDGQLVPADTCRGPRRARQHLLKLRDLELEHLAVR